MKLDLSVGLQSFPSIPGGAVDDLGEDLFAPPSFQLPACSDFDGFQKEAIQMVKPAKGTTTLAFIFKEGVIGRKLAWHGPNVVLYGRIPVSAH
ncbi:hypothetical protein C4D60_Mb09t06980 [Musa balbisiana]|uniref:Uncharacterized protein n=1 Tax=Musa balbisiana TaxID=52838 RepID=A0A4S8IEL6_MUSBA|nr:hypothetical protein C4D60_Mb09t06980 [Musa balbisiana]